MKKTGDGLFLCAEFCNIQKQWRKALQASSGYFYQNKKK